MTATATVLDTHRLDPYGLDLPDLAPVPPRLEQRPDLRVVPGGGAGADPAGPSADEVVESEHLPPHAETGGEAVAERPHMVEVYRRRRFVVALALTVLILAVSQVLGISLTSFGPTPASDDAVPVVHVVRPGDTYPSIAAALGADDPQSVAVELARSNGGAELVVGQRLVIERSALG